jgi:hypothetical protein
MTRSSDNRNRKRFRLKRFAEIKLSTNPNYLIKGILPRVGLAVIWGPPKCGKSFWTFDAVMHPALGWEYRRRKVQQGTVVYCALEGGTGFSRRIEAWRQRYLAEAADGSDVPFYLLDVPLDLIADRAALIETITEQITDAPSPVCIVIDTLNRALGGSENKPEDMAKFIRAADAIRVAFECLVVIVHHSGLEGGRPRGHTSLPGADDVQIKVERDSNGTGTITATVEHMKDDEAGATVTSRLERVELGEDDDGEIMSSCVIVACDDEAAPQKAVGSKAGDWGKGKGAKLLREIIMAMLAEQGTDLRPWADGPSVRALRVDLVKAEFFKTHYADGETEKARQHARRMAFKARARGCRHGHRHSRGWRRPIRLAALGAGGGAGASRNGAPRRCGKPDHDQAASSQGRNSPGRCRLRALPDHGRSPGVQNPRRPRARRSTRQQGRMPA